MATAPVTRASVDRIRTAAAARRRQERALTMAAERIASDFEQGRSPTACMRDLLRALGREEPKRPAKPECVVTAQMRKDLKTIEACGHVGAAKAGTTWRGTGGIVQEENVPALTQAGLAKRDYEWRNPRILLTADGRRALRVDE